MSGTVLKLLLYIISLNTHNNTSWVLLNAYFADEETETQEDLSSSSEIMQLEIGMWGFEFQAVLLQKPRSFLS